MTTFFRKILFGVAMIAFLCPALGVTAAKRHVDTAADARKADYVFMEAMRQHALEHEDAYYELLGRAYQLDTTNSEVAFYRGYYDMMVAREDSLTFEKGYSMMKRHFDEKPEDFYCSFVYGSINDQLGERAEALRVWNALDKAYPAKAEVAFKFAEALASSQDSANVVKSIEVYDRIEKSQGKSIPVSTRKIRAYFISQDTASIFNEVQELIKASPGSPENSVFAGDIYAMFSEPDSALHYYNRACEIDPTFGLAYYSRANYYKSIDDSVGYDREVFQALKQESLELDTKLELLTGYIRALYEDPAQQPRIQELFATLIEQHPHEVAIHDLYCSYLIAISDYAGAAEQISYALDVDPSVEDRWRTLMTLYIQERDYPAAAKAGVTALKYHPESPMINLVLGSVYNQMKDYDNAFVALDRALELTDSADLEELSSIYSSIGDVHYAKGDTTSALEYYNKAIEANPENLLALNNCAYYLAVEGKELDRAEKMSAKTIKEQPDNSSSLDTYAWIMFKKKDFAQAMAYIDKALEKTEEPSGELFEHAGDIYFMNAEPEAALDFWEKALELEPENELLQRKVKHKTYFYE